MVSARNAFNTRVQLFPGAKFYAQFFEIRSKSGIRWNLPTHTICIHMVNHCLKISCQSQKWLTHAHTQSCLISIANTKCFEQLADTREKVSSTNFQLCGMRGVPLLRPWHTCYICNTHTLAYKITFVERKAEAATATQKNLPKNVCRCDRFQTESMQCLFRRLGTLLISHVWFSRLWNITRTPFKAPNNHSSSTAFGGWATAASLFDCTISFKFRFFYTFKTLRGNKRGWGQGLLRTRGGLHKIWLSLGCCCVTQVHTQPRICSGMHAKIWIVDSCLCCDWGQPC